MSRLYVVESVTTLVGAMADHRFALPPAALQRWLLELAWVLRRSRDGGMAGAKARAIGEDLLAHPGRALIVPGERLPPAAHALVHELNGLLGAAGRTVQYIEPVSAAGSCTQSMRELVADMSAGLVDTLVILGGNPVYDAPADLNFGAALREVPFSAHLGLYCDETGSAATWHQPQTHFLEHWSDARGHDGTASIVQPLIAPLYEGMSPHELLSLLMLESQRNGYDAVRSRWDIGSASTDAEATWRTWLRGGVIPGSAAAPVLAHARRAAYEASDVTSAWTVEFRDDQSVRDGEFANNAWLQEIPRPDSKLTWDNAALVAPRSARAAGLRSGDLVEIHAGERRIVAPVWELPGAAEGTITLALGYGRPRAGGIGNRVGVDAYAVRTAAAPWSIPVSGMRKVGEGHLFATTQRHARMEGRDPVRHITLAQYLTGELAAAGRHASASLYPGWPYEDYRWGMAIDLGACIGCNACTIACQAENNIPSVGKEQVALGREMHWIRVDRYYEGSLAAPRTWFQPVPCMHCETAPCEEVCPVGATVHDSEGINVQVYNRCIGTRFCSNNCPYKVRRFNFRQYSDRDIDSLKAARNPQVTVRMRGVMEKCNYCLQRVTRARIESEKAGRRIRDGEVVTACQAVCPTEAISFGDLNDPASRVSRAKRSPLDYALLAELNTAPRTTYTARLTNPNPALPDE